jgi:hypothetical protein
MLSSDPTGLLSHHHIVLSLIVALFILVLIAAGFALSSGVRSKRPRNKQEEYSKFVHDLEKQAEKQVGKLGRGCFGYRSMSGCLAAIEVLGGAYFAITGSAASHGSAIPSDPGGGTQITTATLIGFAIIVTSAIQGKVHPYTKAVELRFRRWNLDHILDRSQKARLDGTSNSRISEVLIDAISEATKPFSDKPEQNGSNAQNPFQTEEIRAKDTAERVVDVQR